MIKTVKVVLKERSLLKDYNLKSNIFLSVQLDHIHVLRLALRLVWLVPEIVL